MSIKNRLLKIEDSLDVNSNFCQCKATHKLEIWHRDRDDEPTLQSAPVPDVCGDCLKPIEKQIIQLHFVESKIKDPREI